MYNVRTLLTNFNRIFMVVVFYICSCFYILKWKSVQNFFLGNSLWNVDGKKFRSLIDRKVDDFRSYEVIY